MSWDFANWVRKGSNLPWYLPSIGSPFSSAVSRRIEEHRPNKQPASIPVPGQLNFLLKDSFFYYPRAMYSAGMAEFNLEKSKKLDKSILSRDRLNTWILADCGGFQAANGTLPIDYNDPDKYLLDNLRWQEHMADVGMMLEIPWHVKDIEFFGGASTQDAPEGSTADNSTLKANYFYQRGEELLNFVEHSFEFFDAHKTSNFKLCMPIHGDSADKAIDWYDRFKKFDHCGYAIGGPLRLNLPDLCYLFDHIKRDGGFDAGKGDYIHMFGVGHARGALAYTALQMVLRKFCNENIQISFDASSPVSQAGRFGEIYNNFTVQPDKYLYSIEKVRFLEQIKGLNPDMRYPYSEGPVLAKMPVREILSDKSTSEMDSLSYAIITAHNVSIHVQAVYASLQRILFDAEILKESLDRTEATGDSTEYILNEDVTTKKDAAAAYLTLLHCMDEIMKPHASYTEKDVYERWSMTEYHRARINSAAGLDYADPTA